jgi:hypothetical protein
MNIINDNVVITYFLERMAWALPVNHIPAVCYIHAKKAWDIASIRAI